jgi:hypothetical protein
LHCCGPAPCCNTCQSVGSAQGQPGSATNCTQQARAWLATSGVKPECAHLAVQAYISDCLDGGSPASSAAAGATAGWCLPPAVIGVGCVGRCNGFATTAFAACNTAWSTCVGACRWGFFGATCKAACEQARQNCYGNARNDEYWCLEQCANIATPGVPVVPPVRPGGPVLWPGSPALTPISWPVPIWTPTGPAILPVPIGIPPTPIVPDPWLF